MKIERNSPCPCGSGKKYKKCCGTPVEEQGVRAYTALKACNFECAKDCSEWCCTGATLLTLGEIRKCYDVFPITIGFRKYSPMSREHEEFLNAAGMRAGNFYVVGDFIAGNWRRGRCMALDEESLCRLHREERKPLQCLIVPFCAIYPESKQDIIFAEQRGGKFAKCKGFRPAEDTRSIVWENGRFTDPHYRDAFSCFQEGLVKQRPIMQKILEGLGGKEAYREFFRGEGILETFIPLSMLFDVLEAGGLPEGGYYSFLKEQSRLCYKELVVDRGESPVLEDYLNELNRIAELYAGFVKKQKDIPRL